ncbi:hypothetical protein EVAR_57347_1 [Eumeta japonica]|uniref:Uncharacterized protein n=1 Tax=Eumeta variegata TaxID=151549 RepID=A0A4C1Z3B9_EUMVA|nr:hypothetical protein EVAR_57347_1 [Eumeta japonica]
MESTSRPLSARVGGAAELSPSALSVRRQQSDANCNILDGRLGFCTSKGTLIDRTVLGYAGALEHTMAQPLCALGIRVGVLTHRARITAYRLTTWSGVSPAITSPRFIRRAPAAPPGPHVPAPSIRRAGSGARRARSVNVIVADTPAVMTFRN